MTQPSADDVVDDQRLLIRLRIVEIIEKLIAKQRTAENLETCYHVQRLFTLYNYYMHVYRPTCACNYHLGNFTLPASSHPIASSSSSFSLSYPSVYPASLTSRPLFRLPLCSRILGLRFPSPLETLEFDFSHIL